MPLTLDGTNGITFPSGNTQSNAALVTTGGTITGNLTVTNSIALGSASISSGVGIAFPASQSTSSDANTLDDYEEGTFAADVFNNGSTSTWTVKQGRYVKIGSKVTIWFCCDNGNSGTAGGALLLALPFTGVTNLNNSQVGVFSHNGANPDGRTIVLVGSAGAVQFWNMATGTNQYTGQVSFITGTATYTTT